MNKKPSVTIGYIRMMDPNISESEAKSLAEVWDDVVDMIVNIMLSYDKSDAPLHINLRAEMAMFTSQMVCYFSENVVKNRTKNRSISDIDPEAERASCFSECGDGGMSKIKETAENFYEKVWKPRMETRWIPKAAKAIERDEIPKEKQVLSVRAVKKKHYIAEWIIRDYWSIEDRCNRRRTNNSVWSNRRIPYGSWGYVKGLWSDKLESYFSLLEGDAKKPYQMLLRTEPINPPQMDAFVGFLVIHILRNPSSINYQRAYAREFLEARALEIGSDFNTVANDSFEALFGVNKIYQAYACPIFESRWAIVSSERPVFVLPDNFCVRARVGDRVKFLVPMSPTKCFITLARPPVEKAIIPVQHRADENLASMISRLLIDGSDREFLSHHDFTVPVMDGTPPPTLGEVIRIISKAIPDHYFRY